MTERSCTYRNPWNVLTCTECGEDLSLCQCPSPEFAAHQRLHSPDGAVFAMIRGELEAARKQFPENTHMLVALMEEVGELSQALIDHDRAQAKSAAEVLREAVQVACMAIRVATEGDDNFAYIFPAVEEELPRGPVGGQF